MGLDSFGILPQEFISLCLSLDLTDNLFFSEEMFHIFPQSARHRIKASKSVFQFILVGLTASVAVPDILHQFPEGHIVLYHAMRVPVRNFQLLCNAGADECDAVRDMHVLLHVYCHTHHRAVYRHKSRYQLRYVSFHIVYDCRTGLGDSSGEIMFRDIFQIAPCRDVCAKGNATDMIYSLFLEQSQYLLIFRRIVCNECRRNDDRYLFACRKILKESVRVILIVPRIMLAGIKAGAARNTHFAVHRDLPRLCRIVRRQHRTCPHTLVAAGTIVIRKNQSVHHLHFPPSSECILHLS